MDRPDTPTAIIEGPFRGAWPPPAQHGDPPGQPRWIVSASFATEAEAQGFAVWCQTANTHMITTGPPVVTWTEVDHAEPPTAMLPPEGILIAVDAVDSHNDRATGQGQVQITYTLIARSGRPPWDALPPPPTKGGD